MPFSSLWRRLRYLFHRDEFAAGLDEEMDLHLHLRARKLHQQGLDDGQARFAARRQFGSPAAVLDASSQPWGWTSLDRLSQDFRQAARTLRKSPAFAAFAVLTLGLGLGMNTAIFSVVNGVMLRGLPYPQADRLVSLWEETSRQDPRQFNSSSGGLGRRTARRTTVSAANLVDYQHATHAFEALAGYDPSPRNLTGSGNPERVSGEAVTADFFSVLGIPPVMGRAFLPEDDRFDAPPVVIVTHAFWQRRLGGDPAVLGQTVNLDSRPHQIVGVLPRDFQSPYQLVVPDPVEFYVPASLPKALLASRGDHELNVAARLRPGVSVATAQAELQALSAQLGKQFPASNDGLRAVIAPLRDDLTSSIHDPLYILLGASGLIVVITCVNIANLLLVRAIARRHETSVRFALGASRFRVIRQFLAESMLIACAGCAAGILIGIGLLRLLLGMAPRSLPRLHGVTLDWRVFAVATALATFTGLLFGLAPAWHAASSKAADALKTAARHGGSRPVVFWRIVLTGGEIALSLILLTGAGLLLRSFVTVMGVNLGFQPDRVIAMSINLPTLRYATPAQRLRFFQQLEERVRALPGVQSAAYANRLPLRGGWGGSVYADNSGPRYFDVDRQAVSDGFFQTLGISLVRGRLFTADDADGRQRVTVVDQNFARTVFGDADPIGRNVRNASNGPWSTIVGVVTDIHRAGKDRPSNPQLYIPASQTEAYTVVRLADFAVRTAGNPRDLLNHIQQQVWSLDKEQPITAIRTLQEIVDASVAERRFETTLLLIFAALAVGLATLGVFGVLSYSVSQRTTELGIRIALGAQPWGIVTMMLRHAGMLVAGGIAVGLAGAYALSTLMASLLFQVKPHDPLTYIAAVLVLTAISLVAAVIPARRGAGTDPIVALRYD